MQFNRLVRAAAILTAGVTLLTVGGMAGTALAAVPAPTVPSNPALIVARASEEFARLAGRSCEASEKTAARAVRAMIEVKRHGGSNDDIKAKGEAGIAAINADAATAAAAIEAARAKAADALSAAGGTADQLARLNANADRATKLVNQCAKRSAELVARAQTRLTGPSTGGGMGSADLN